MTLEEIKELKDRVYELEGLLELAQLREDKLEELVPLIVSRLNSLAPKEEKEEYDVKETEEVEPGVGEMSLGGIFGDEVNVAGEEPVSMERTLSSDAENTRRPLFCLNDRFRFRRTLFNGSEESFSEAMKRIAQMDNYEEAMEYFIDEYGWNPDDEEVTAFFEIIESYFSGNY